MARDPRLADAAGGCGTLNPHLAVILRIAVATPGADERNACKVGGRAIQEGQARGRSRDSGLRQARSRTEGQQLGSTSSARCRIGWKPLSPSSGSLVPTQCESGRARNDGKCTDSVYLYWTLRGRYTHERLPFLQIRRPRPAGRSRGGYACPSAKLFCRRLRESVLLPILSAILRLVPAVL